MSSLFGKPKMPAIKDPTPMPDEDQLDKSRIRRIAVERQASGRESTNLTQAGGREKLGA